MLSPHELKNREFSKSLRGYSTVEVDEHIEFIIEKYAELYRSYDALQKKLRLTEAQLDAMKAEEESIRGALINAQKASSRIIDEANERSDVIMRSAKSSCDRLIAELKAEVMKENERLDAVRAETAAFKAVIFEAYQIHIGQIQSIAPDEAPVSRATEADASKYAEIVMERIKESLAGRESVIGGSEVPYAEKKSENETASGKTVSAESKIPENVTEKTPEKDTSTEIRDASEFDGSDEKTKESDSKEDQSETSDNSEEEYSEDKYSTDDSIEDDRAPAADSGRGVKGSIKDINRKIESGSDDELLKIFEAAPDSKEMSATEEFHIVYDGKKKQ